MKPSEMAPIVAAWTEAEREEWRRLYATIERVYGVPSRDARIRAFMLCEVRKQRKITLGMTQKEIDAAINASVQYLCDATLNKRDACHDPDDARLIAEYTWHSSEDAARAMVEHFYGLAQCKRRQVKEGVRR